jgi:Ni,Fe-hydrogenase III component G
MNVRRSIHVGKQVLMITIAHEFKDLEGLNPTGAPSRSELFRYADYHPWR